MEIHDFSDKKILVQLWNISPRRRLLSQIFIFIIESDSKSFLFKKVSHFGLYLPCSKNYRIVTKNSKASGLSVFLQSKLHSRRLQQVLKIINISFGLWFAKNYHFHFPWIVPFFGHFLPKLNSWDGFGNRGLVKRNSGKRNLVDAQGWVFASWRRKSWSGSHKNHQRNP